jgi:REP element-mobilizing transposase RayT
MRLPGYDYTQPGMYFITICTNNSECLFGKILNGQIMLNEFGRIVKLEWLKTHIMRKNVIIDQYVIMPDHMHCILVIDNKCRDTVHRIPTFEQFGKPVSGSIPTIIRSFKAVVTKRINTLRNTPGRKIWQSSFYEHIIRNKREYYAIRRYIINNPTKW